ncbi:hypothetical protein ES703_65067 [subsurface metagenome]
MIKQRFVPIVWFSLFFLPVSLQAQDDWKLVRQDKDIKVYLHKSWKENKTYRAEAIIKAPIDTVYHFLTDFHNYINWVYNCKKIEVIEEEKDVKYVYYAYYDLPWPFTDRDAISVHRIIHYTDGRKDVKSTPGNDYLPVEEDVIRIEEFEEYYQLIPLSDKTMHLKMKGKYDPGGYIPDWLVKQFLSMGPLDALQEIKKNSEKKVTN